MKTNTIRVIDLFAGIGGTRLGFEQAAKKNGFEIKCVFTSEIKKHAVEVLNQNFKGESVHGDITQIDASLIPDFDFLLAGFPCQPFSAGGKRKGFIDTRGTMFFEVERILKEKKPIGFLLENVEGLVMHDRVDKTKRMGRTLETIITKLNDLGYKTSWALLDSKYFGVAQSRKRIYIVGTLKKTVRLDFATKNTTTLAMILEKGLPTLETPFVKNLMNKYSLKDLYGKSVKDKRGGDSNIHGWDLELKGPITKQQKHILNSLLKERRKKHWAEKKGMKWMDGMPLTHNEIMSVINLPNLKELLEDLVNKGYLRFEHPKDIVTETDLFGNQIQSRKHNPNIEKGYNIVTGKLSYEVNKILDPKDIAPTLVATDVERLVVPDGNGLRKLSLREGLRLFGFPENFKLEISEKDGFDLLGNTVVVNVIEAVAEKIIKSLIQPDIPTSKYSTVQAPDLTTL